MIYPSGLILVLVLVLSLVHVLILQVLKKFVGKDTNTMLVALASQCITGDTAVTVTITSSNPSLSAGAGAGADVLRDRGQEMGIEQLLGGGDWQQEPQGDLPPSYFLILLLYLQTLLLLNAPPSLIWLLS